MEYAPQPPPPCWQRQRRARVQIKLIHTTASASKQADNESINVHIPISHDRFPLSPAPVTAAAPVQRPSLLQFHFIYIYIDYRTVSNTKHLSYLATTTIFCFFFCNFILPGKYGACMSAGLGLVIEEQRLNSKSISNPTGRRRRQYHTRQKARGVVIAK